MGGPASSSPFQAVAARMAPALRMAARADLGPTGA